MKRYCLSLLIIVIISMIGYGEDNAHAYTMADYWSLDAGDVWVFDRDIQIFTSETHVFEKYTGRMWASARMYCENRAYFYQGPEGILMLGLYNAENNQFKDLSNTPLKLASAEMNLGESITSTAILEGPVTFTITLEGVENVTVPAGSFADTLRVNIFVSDTDGTYTLKVWLAKGVGTVKVQRVSETGGTTGCFLDCGAFDCKTGDVVVQRVISLTSYYANTTKNKVVIVPLF
jgi:hypothetical protein